MKGAAKPTLPSPGYGPGTTVIVGKLLEEECVWKYIHMFISKRLIHLWKIKVVFYKPEIFSIYVEHLKKEIKKDIAMVVWIRNAEIKKKNEYFFS